jgi:GTP-binding protein
VENVRMITNELGKYSEELLNKERWLILNKIDLLPPDQVDNHCEDIVKRLNWTGKVFRVSGLAREGIDYLAQQSMNYLEGQGKEDDF